MLLRREAIVNEVLISNLHEATYPVTMSDD